MSKSQPSNRLVPPPQAQVFIHNSPQKKVIHKIWQLSTCDQKIKSTAHSWAQPVYKIIEPLA